MKYIVTTCIYILALFTLACNTHPETNKKKYPDSTNATDSLINSAGNYADTNYREGARLIASNDCLTCHRIEEKINGPSYREVAVKYGMNEGNVDNLAHAIIHGSKGLWGKKEMTPHPTLSVDEARKMARYILSLDTTSGSDSLR